MIVRVTSGNRCSLTVVDDPEFAPLEYRLVDNQALPGSAAGQVGLMSWGMSGSVPRGLRIANVLLQPVPLVGNPNGLQQWTPVVPPRQGGDNTMGSGNGGRPIWSLALGPSGPYGTLHENSDAFGANDTAGQVDYIAASLVAGDTQWTDYVLTARIIPRDDDGHGVLVRYLDEQNFYRIGLRRQNSPTGVPQGLSIQKVVAGVFSEVIRDNRFVPPDNVPYEISAAVSGNRLQVVVVADPDGAAMAYVYGPFELTDGTVDRGKIGLFSWAMARTEFDYVRVQSVSGTPLQVSSAHGAPNPSAGWHGFAPGTDIQASVDTPVETHPGVRRLCAGWTGFGSVPPTGNGNSVSFTLSGLSFLKWNWSTEMRLAPSATAGGKLNLARAWLPEGTVVNLRAEPDPGYLFWHWSGDLATTASQLDLTMNRPYTLHAQFAADADGDGLPDPWERSYFGNLDPTPDGDPDRDRRSNRLEFERGTHPNHAEQLSVADGLAAKWENTQRDPVLPGQWLIRDFGGGLRGPSDSSNDYRAADDPTFIGANQVVPNVSFEGPRLIIRPEFWDPAWTDFNAETVFSVGDNDGNCVYFRYVDEENWYRVTVTGENNNAAWRAPFGVTVQKRVNGVFTELAQDATIATDPTDVAFFKRVRITVQATGPNFEVRVTGWDTLQNPPVWLTTWEAVLLFADDALPAGRLGIGCWGQGPGESAPTNPVNAGVLFEEVTVQAGGNVVFHDDWTQAPLQYELPAVWSNPFAGAAASGDWSVSAHGTVVQFSNYGPATSGSLAVPSADAEGPILLATAPDLPDYWLELAFHPFDDDGLGFVYDFTDADNYARVLFASEASGAERIPQGLTVSRKAAGVWSDLIAGDAAFVYRPGQPFAAEFANNNGEYQLTAWSLDDPAQQATWRWVEAKARPGNRFGLATWAMTDGHFLHARAYGLPGRGPLPQLKIARVSLSGGNVVLEISNPGGTAYNVERTTDLGANSWTVIAAGQTGATWTTPVPTGSPATFWRLVVP